MTFRLLCGGDPVALGIADANGWNLDAFKRHILECPLCAALTQNLTRLIRDKETPSGKPKGN